MTTIKIIWLYAYRVYSVLCSDKIQVHKISPEQYLGNCTTTILSSRRTFKTSTQIFIGLYAKIRNTHKKYHVKFMVIKKGSDIKLIYQVMTNICF